MGCPASLVALQGVEANTKAMKELIEQLLQPKPPIPQLQYTSSLYDTLCSSVGTVRKQILADDTTLPADSTFTRLTLTVRDMGTNTYIAYGPGATPAKRFRANDDTHTFIAPIMNGNVIPFIANITLLGDGANGVIEVTGIRISKMESVFL